MGKIYVFAMVLVTSMQINAQSLYFPPLTGNAWDTISPAATGYCQEKIDSLYTFLGNNNTKAFLLLKDGKIVLEKYFGGQTQSSLWQWASAGKTITSFLTGMAQQEGHLRLTDATSKYLGQGWTSCTSDQEEKITIRNQLTMTTGLDDGVDDNSCTLDTCLVYKAAAGSRWAYHNGPYTLLDQVIKAATGLTLNQYHAQKLKNPTGMTGTFVPVENDNVYFSNARSMARYGLLILNKGNWNGQQIMTDTSYFRQMTNTSQLINKSYGYLWWLNGKQSYMVPSSQFVFQGSVCPHAPDDMISGMGKNGQFLNVVPSQNLIWIRMGEAPNNLPVPFLLNDAIWEYVNDLQCQPTGSDDIVHHDVHVQISPNPSHENLNIAAEDFISRVEIYNLQGQLVKAADIRSQETTLQTGGLANGFYFIKVSFDKGKTWTGRFIKA